MEVAALFTCDCGGTLTVHEVEPFPEELGAEEQLEYVRKCKVICNDCGNVKENLPYDNP